MLTLQVHQRLDGGSTSSFSACGPQDDKASAIWHTDGQMAKEEEKMTEPVWILQLPHRNDLVLPLLPPWPIIQGTGQRRHQGLGMPTYPTSGRRGRTEEFLKGLVRTPNPTVHPGATRDFYSFHFLTVVPHWLLSS